MSDLIDLISCPTYTTKIPSTGKKVTYRPFVVKEEKILLIAQESKDTEQIFNAVKTIFESCFKEKIDFDSLTYFDVEYLFVQLRMKSMGEIVEIMVKDPETKEKFETTMELEKIKIVNMKKDKNYFNIKLNDNLGITLKYPNLKTMTKLKGETLNSTTESVMELITNSIESIYTKDQVIHTKDRNILEVKQFVENLPKNMFAKLTNFFKELPYVVYEDEFVTPAGKKIPIFVKDFNNFFR